MAVLPGGTGHELPQITELIPVDIARAAAIQQHGGAACHRAIGARVGDRRRVRRVDGDEIGSAGHLPVMNDERQAVLAFRSQEEGRPNRRGLQEGYGAARRLRDDIPLIGQRIAVNVERTSAIERDRRVSSDCLVRPGVGLRRGIGGRNREVRAVGQLTVADFNPNDVGTGTVGKKAGKGAGRRCDRGAAARRTTDDRPQKREWTAFGIRRSARVERHRLRDERLTDRGDIGIRWLIRGGRCHRPREIRRVEGEGAILLEAERIQAAHGAAGRGRSKRHLAIDDDRPRRTAHDASGRSRERRSRIGEERRIGEFEDRAGDSRFADELIAADGQCLRAQEQRHDPEGRGPPDHEQREKSDSLHPLTSHRRRDRQTRHGETAVTRAAMVLRRGRSLAECGRPLNRDRADRSTIYMAVTIPSSPKPGESQSGTEE